MALGALSQAQAAGFHAPQAQDTPNDGGRSVTIVWETTEDVDPEAVVVVERVRGGQTVEVGRVPTSARVFVDGRTAEGSTGPDDGVEFRYRLTEIDPSGVASVAVDTNPTAARAQLFNRNRINVLAILATFFAFVLINVWRASRGTKFFIRELPPVTAMEEAIGRATEMGRPVLYVPGIEEVEDIQTIASMMILERIAEKTATYDVPLRVPVRTPFVLAVADEVVRTGCTAAGRPDAYRPENLQFISSEQFAYCAGVNGIILREKPAANMYLGRFFAESLIFAETGFAAGSIQIAGTAEVTQLPFFIAACDYTLIGEEFFAAGAYLSQDPSLLSTLKAADWAKILLVSLLVIGAVLETMGYSEFRQWFEVR